MFSTFLHLSTCSYTYALQHDEFHQKYNNTKHSGMEVSISKNCFRIEVTDVVHNVNRLFEFY